MDEVFPFNTDLEIFAQQWTIYEQQYFKKIDLREFLPSCKEEISKLSSLNLTSLHIGFKQKYSLKVREN